MSEHGRNVAVGLTVIGALVLLGAMIVIFAGIPQMFQGGYALRLLFDSTHDAHEGDPVHLRGCRVGRIVRIDFTDGDPRKGVTITARINGDVNLPGDTKAYIFSKGVTGGGYLELKPEGEAWIDPRTRRAVEFLPKDGSVVIEGAHRGTELLPGDLVERSEFPETNQRVVSEGGEPASAKPVLLGVTKAALNTESFLSASSFQHTIKVLAGAAIEGKRDELKGLKENVIIGKLIPAGTGFWEYRKRALAASTQPEDAVEAILGAELGGTGAAEGLDLLAEGLGQEIGGRAFDLDGFMSDEDLDEDELDALNVFLDDDSDEDEHDDDGFDDMS